ncbi:hypothetical protein AQUCO_03600096v1 [Aquilegia coerulea]|uniref:RING-type domain-containing protein n=1 Tax=Aquilegia coerulea TaxID=218851 RepID=A0A2G5CV88_AQUCA|nr:hypothetical protein AQUCO_03600096v1 [Aquilegia coerulea]
MASIPTKKGALDYIEENYRDQDEETTSSNISTRRLKQKEKMDVLEEEESEEENNDSYEDECEHYNIEEEPQIEKEEEEVDDYDGEEVREDESVGSDNEEKNDDKYVTMKLSKIYGNIACPICSGILKKARAATECMHRFCGECIDKAMETGNQECPVCRVQIPNLRSLRDDVNYDRIVAIICADMKKYENEVLI